MNKKSRIIIAENIIEETTIEDALEHWDFLNDVVWKYTSKYSKLLIKNGLEPGDDVDDEEFDKWHDSMGYGDFVDEFKKAIMAETIKFFFERQKGKHS